MCCVGESLWWRVEMWIGWMLLGWWICAVMHWDDSTLMCCCVCRVDESGWWCVVCMLCVSALMCCVDESAWLMCWNVVVCRCFGPDVLMHCELWYAEVLLIENVRHPKDGGGTKKRNEKRHFGSFINQKKCVLNLLVIKFRSFGPEKRFNEKQIGCMHHGLAIISILPELCGVLCVWFWGKDNGTKKHRMLNGSKKKCTGKETYADNHRVISLLLHKLNPYEHKQCQGSHMNRW